MLAVLALAAAALSACSPAPAPDPEPTTAFASEEEAFAAAEEVYRAYLQASAEINTADPGTFEPVYELTSDGVNASDRKSFSEMHAERLEMSGESKLLSFKGLASEPPYDLVTTAVCLDVSDVQVTDSDGNSRVNADRPDTYALELGFVTNDQHLLLSSSKKIEDAECGSQ
jgi:hypothetical protein